MRYVLAALLATACASEPDGRQQDMDIALDAVELPATEADTDGAEPDGAELAAGLDVLEGWTEQTIQTIECGSGGTVRVTVRRETGDEPYRRKGNIQWRYDACGTWPYGTIDGTASYSREVSGGPPWVRKLRYFADLDYTGTEDGACNAYVQLDQTWASAEHPMVLPSTCPHPVREWWDRLGIDG